MGLFSLELRDKFFKRFGYVLFTDIGSIYDKYEKIDLRGIKLAYGVGFRFFTKIGPIRLDLGFDNDDMKDNLFKSKFKDKVKVFISIGQAF